MQNVYIITENTVKNKSRTEKWSKTMTFGIIGQYYSEKWSKTMTFDIIG